MNVSPIEFVLNRVIENPVGSILLLLFIIWIIVVRFYNEQRLSYGDIRITGMVENLSTIRDSKAFIDITEAYHFAILSAEVYGTLDDKGRPVREWQVENCSHQSVYNQWELLNLPKTFPTKPIGQNGGQVRLDSPLVYNVWYRENGQDEVVVAIAFAGTDGLGDFWSNLHWLTRFWPGGWSQYDMAATVGAAVEAFARKEKFKDKKRVRVVTTGHSLGGGLAHVAAYAAKNIKTVYAFDSSSVTGFYDVDKTTRDASKIGMRIYRMHERGEILGYLRAFMRVLYPAVEKNPAIIDATVNFDDGQPIGQHSIENLACALMESSDLSDAR